MTKFERFKEYLLHLAKNEEIKILSNSDYHINYSDFGSMGETIRLQHYVHHKSSHNIYCLKSGIDLYGKSKRLMEFEKQEKNWAKFVEGNDE